MAYNGSKKKINKSKKRLTKSPYKKIKRGGVDTQALKTKLCENVDEHHLPGNIENQLRKLNKLNTAGEKVYAFKFLRQFYERAYNSRRRNTRAEEGTFRVFKPTGPKKEQNKCDIAGEIIDLAIWSARHVPRIDNLIINLNRLNLEIGKEIFKIDRMIILLLKRKTDRQITNNQYNNTHQKLKTKMENLENMKTELNDCLENLRRFDRNNLQSFKNLRNNRETQPMIERCKEIYREKNKEFQPYRNKARNRETARRLNNTRVGGSNTDPNLTNSSNLGPYLSPNLSRLNLTNSNTIRMTGLTTEQLEEELTRLIAAEGAEENYNNPILTRTNDIRKRNKNIVKYTFKNIFEKEIGNDSNIRNSINRIINNTSDDIVNGLSGDCANQKSCIQQKIRHFYNTQYGKKRNSTKSSEGRLRFLTTSKSNRKEHKKNNRMYTLQSTIKHFIQQQQNKQQQNEETAKKIRKTTI